MRPDTFAASAPRWTPANHNSPSGPTARASASVPLGRWTRAGRAAAAGPGASASATTATKAEMNGTRRRIGRIIAPRAASRLRSTAAGGGLGEVGADPPRFLDVAVHLLDQRVDAFVGDLVAQLLDEGDAQCLP